MRNYLYININKKKLHNWVTFDLKERFNNKTLDIDIHVATTWGAIQAQSELAGQTLPSIDGLIASTAITHNLTLATRNTKDMKASGVALINPWEPTENELTKTK
ncbi:MAG: PIN domain-containing protein [Thermodesulfobacteriota bacterium]|nr:PIN domain-containing protein [Thermodesulfobacteriota bacterium]